MKNHQQTVDRLYKLAASERACRNYSAAESALKKARALEVEHNLKPHELSPAEREAAWRLAAEKYWKSIKPSTQVIIRRQKPGLPRPVDEVVLMACALPLLQTEQARFVRLASDTNGSQFYEPDLGKLPLPAPYTPEQLAQIRDHGKSGTVPREFSHFASHAVDDRGKPYAADGKNQTWWGRIRVLCHLE
jgi:hypothetical protein